MAAHSLILFEWNTEYADFTDFVLVRCMLNKYPLRGVISMIAPQGYRIEKTRQIDCHSVRRDRLAAWIAVSKRWLEVRGHGEAESRKIGNDPDGFTTLIEQMKAVGSALIVFEATGGDENRAGKTLREAGVGRARVETTPRGR